MPFAEFAMLVFVGGLIGGLLGYCFMSWRWSKEWCGLD